MVIGHLDLLCDLELPLANEVYVIEWLALFAYDCSLNALNWLHYLSNLSQLGPVVVLEDFSILKEESFSLKDQLLLLLDDLVKLRSRKFNYIRVL